MGRLPYVSPRLKAEDYVFAKEPKGVSRAALRRFLAENPSRGAPGNGPADAVAATVEAAGR